MRIVRGHSILNEDILDDIEFDDIEQLDSVSSGTVMSPEEIDARPWKHTAYYLYTLRSKRQTELFFENFANISESFMAKADSERRITSSALEILMHMDDEGVLSLSPSELIRKGYDENIIRVVCQEGLDYAPLFADVLYAVMKQSVKGRYNVEFRFRFDTVSGMTIRDALRVAATVFGINMYTINAIVSFTKNDIDQCLTFDGTYCKTFHYHSGYLRSFKWVFSRLLGYGSASELSEEEKKAVQDYLNAKKKSAMDSVSIPDELKALITPSDLIYISESGVQITMNSAAGVIQCSIPRNRRVQINHVLFIWYYCDKYMKTHPEWKGVDVIVNGTMSIGNDLFSSDFGNWYSCIEHVETLYSESTEFKKLNTMFLQKVFVQEMILNNPVLQTTKGDADIQKCQLYCQAWENPDVVIKSPSHNITIEPDAKSPNKIMMTAVKK